jgi:Domain of unknown function (DUF4878)
MIQFRCPKCHVVLKIKDSIAGRKGSCPKCGQRLRFPEPPPEKVSPSNPAPAATPQVVPTLETKEPSNQERLPVATKPPLSFFARIPRRSLLIAGLALALLPVLGLAWFAFSHDSPSKVLVSTIMKANTGNYSGADESLLPETVTAVKSRIMTQLMWDNITKKGTVQDVKVLNEQIRGEGATVRISVEYKDGPSSQVEEMMSKVEGKWKVSLMGLMQANLWGSSAPGLNSSGFVPPDPQDPLGSGRSRQLPVASNQKHVNRPPALAKKPAASPNAPDLQRHGDEYQLAIEKLAEFQRTGDDATRSRTAKELAELSGKWTKDESLQVIDAVAKLRAAGKPLARLLCQVIANGPLTASSIQADPARRNALAALESVHPDLYEPVIRITIEHWKFRDRAANRLAELGDSSVTPILLNRLKEATGGSWFWDTRDTFIAYMEALQKLAPDDPSTFEIILAIAKARAKNRHSQDVGVPVAAVKMLSRFGSKAKEAAPTLKQLKLDQNGTMRQAASDALKEIDAKE